MEGRESSLIKAVLQEFTEALPSRTDYLHKYSRCKMQRL